MPTIEPQPPTTPPPDISGTPYRGRYDATGAPMDQRIKLTSTRTGAVAWLRADGTPAAYASEAGYFTTAAAQAQIDTYRASLIAVIKRCAWTFELVA